MIEEIVKQIIAKQLELEEEAIVPNARLVEDLGADSLDKVELLLAFEKFFNIEMPESEVKEFFLVQDAINYVREYTEQK